MTTPITVVAAEITQPSDEADRPRFLQDVLALPGVDGLEIPVASGLFEADRPWLVPALPAGSRHVLTLVGATMERAKQGAGFASPQRDGRAIAFALAESARTLVGELAARDVHVAAVVVQSAPTAVSTDRPAAVSALTSSLRDLARLDWHGAHHLLEHCDARRDGATHVKGFLPIDDEIAVLTRLRDEGIDVGMLINWGRSAIEGRSAATPLEHLAAASAAGVLSGVIVSGVATIDGDYGDAWSDTHAPAQPTMGCVGEPSSLLTLHDAAAFFAAAGPDLLLRGVKVSLKAPDASEADRLAVNAAVLATLTGR